jgi:hypothetical protein
MEAHQEQGGQVMDLLKEAGIGDRSDEVAEQTQQLNEGNTYACQAPK